MKTSKSFVVSGIAASVVLMLALTVGLTLAQGSDQPQGPTGTTADAPGAIPIQGRLTDASGTPLNGTYTLTFGLYEDAAAVSALCADVRLVSVTNGLFSDYMDHCSDDITGQRLWLGIQVGSDPEMTPRQIIYPVPYALGLVPGAVISRTNVAATLNAYNHGTGWGLDAYSRDGDAAHGRSESSVHAGLSGENNGGGIGVYAYSDTGVAVMASGTGVIKSTADSYVFVPGTAFIKETDTDTTRWDLSGGSALIRRGGVAVGTKHIRIPITLPSVLYGQPVRVTSVTVYYKCQDGTVNYVSETELYKQTSADSFVSLVNDTTNRTSNTATSYSLATDSANNILSSSQGILTLRLGLFFNDDNNYVQIGGVRVTLAHTY